VSEAVRCRRVELTSEAEEDRPARATNGSLRSTEPSVLVTSMVKAPVIESAMVKSTMIEHGTRDTNVAAAVSREGDPPPDGGSAALVADDLILGIDGTSTRGITDNSMIGFRRGGNSKSDGTDSGDEGKDFFHGVMEVMNERTKTLTGMAVDYSVELNRIESCLQG